MEDKTEKLINEFCELYKANMPKEILFEKCEERYTEVMHAIHMLAHFVYRSSPNAEITINRDCLVGDCIALTIVADMLIFDDMKAFCIQMLAADNFEINVLTDSLKIEMGVMFQGVYEIKGYRK